MRIEILKNLTKKIVARKIQEKKHTHKRNKEPRRTEKEKRTIEAHSAFI